MRQLWASGSAQAIGCWPYINPVTLEWAAAAASEGHVPGHVPGRLARGINASW